MKAADFGLTEYHTGQRVHLHDFAGKPVMLTFWVSWCPDCGRDLPLKKQFFESLQNDELGFLTINVTGREHSPEDGPSYVDKFNLPFPVLLDEERKVYDLYQCHSVPTTVLLNASHEITHQFDDKTSLLEIMQALSSMMS